jgi:hypothetical protein
VLCERAGHPARAVDGRVHVSADPDWAPELNRLAMAHGITLAALGISHGSLEEAFLSITDAGGSSIAQRLVPDPVAAAAADGSPPGEAR